MRRFLVVLLTLVAILSAGWFALQRADIGYDRLELVYANSDSRILPLENGLRVHYRDVGPRNAPVIVLVHGFSSSLHTWEPWVANLKRDYRVISLDLPGHGLTNCLEGERVGTEQFVETVDAVTRALGIDTFTLAGNSMGGGVAWAYALAHPSRLEGLVLVDASGWPENAQEEKTDPLVFKLLSNPVARRLMKNTDMTWLVRDGLRDSFADPDLATDDMVNRYTALARAPCHRDALMALTSGGGDRARATKEALAKVTVPTLVLHGEQDKLIPVAAAQKFADAIPGAKLVTYANAGHLPQEELAEDSASDLRAFLAGLNASETASTDPTEGG
ncbi:alpha/beta fold hydrolase [Hyphomonas sp.]|uniref:alpha/beta fold hydrolase n=1 Tax=Hyphomonas sp. TaxID=87 RepID=UPI003526F922